MDHTPIPFIGETLLYETSCCPYALRVSKDHHHHPEEERRSSIVRVRKVVGQLNAVERMLDEDRDCPEILTQIVSARRGLKSLAEKLIHSHAIIASKARKTLRRAGRNCGSCSRSWNGMSSSPLMKRR